jgi:hypothetical protein
MALHGTGLTIGRNDGPAPEAGRAGAHRNALLAVAQTDNYAAALDGSSAAAAPDSSFAAADNSPPAAIRNSVVAVTDNCAAAQSNCVPAATGTGAGFEAGWTLVVGVVPDASVVTGWVPGGKDAEEGRCDDSAHSVRGTAPLPEPASLCTRPAGAEFAPLLSSLFSPEIPYFCVVHPTALVYGFAFTSCWTCKSSIKSESA